VKVKIIKTNIMKRILAGSIIIFIAFSSCKKSSTSTSPTPIAPAKTCQLIFWKATEVASPTYFEYNSNGKLSKSRWFSNGLFSLPTTRVFEYNTQNQIVKIADSVPNAMSVNFLNYNTAGYPLKAIYNNGINKESEFEYEYDSKNNISIKTVQFFNNAGTPVGKKDSLKFYYNAAGNMIKETAITSFNGIRREYILLEVEGYDTKPNFYKSLGNEFNFLYRYNRNGEGHLNQGDYIYSMCTNNPSKVYLHNQDLTDDSNKGDYLTYTYEYDAITGYPSKISFTYTQLGVTRGPSFATVNFSCK
jgi:hypothetical protein